MVKEQLYSLLLSSLYRLLDFNDDKYKSAWDAGHIGMRVVIIYSLIRGLTVGYLPYFLVPRKKR